MEEQLKQILEKLDALEGGLQRMELRMQHMERYAGLMYEEGDAGGQYIVSTGPGVMANAYAGRIHQLSLQMERLQATMDRAEAGNWPHGSIVSGSRFTTASHGYSFIGGGDTNIITPGGAAGSPFRPGDAG